MKKIIIILIMAVFIVSCSNDNIAENKNNNVIEENSKRDYEKVVVVDSTGIEFVFEEKPKTVVTLGASLTDIWLLSGGVVAGTSNDSFDRADLGLDSNSVVDIGGYNNINVEEVIKLQPDLVIFAPKIKGQEQVASTLVSAGIPVFYADVQSFEDYLTILKNFTEINDSEELYQINGLAVENKINEYILLASEMQPTTGLFLRSSASTLKALPRDSFQIKIIEDMGIKNIADDDSNILDNLSMEAIIKANPEYIFLVIMGNEEDGEIKIEEYIAQNPVWNELTAVKEGRFIKLPKELFHNKPNSKWGDAYEQIYNIRKGN